MNNEINNFQEKCLRIVYSDKKSSFEKLKSVPIRIRNQQILATEIFKVNISLAPTTFSELFKKNEMFNKTCVLLPNFMFQM